VDFFESFDEPTAKKLANIYPTPLYLYSRHTLEDQAKNLLALSCPFGFIPRYAVKANPHHDIIHLFNEKGLHFDASSEFECEHLLALGIDPSKISLSSQQPPDSLKHLLNKGVKFVATSLHQLDLVSQTGWRGNLAVRVNPGIGSGHTNRTTTGGINSSFGIWHEYLPQVLQWQSKSGCVIDRLHIHIGSGSDIKIWQQVMVEALKIVDQLPSVVTLDIGGGYKVGRMPGEQSINLPAVVEDFNIQLIDFHGKTKREIALEIEPGTWLVANAGILLSEIVDIVDTGPSGFNFIKLNTGLNDLLRPALYGAQHPIKVLNNSHEQRSYVVVGHNCESGDLLTPALAEPEQLGPRLLNEPKIGDLVAIGGVGAYSASMRAIGYNSFPAAKELVI
jgi:diaminopimelate decarboxylase